MNELTLQCRNCGTIFTMQEGVPLSVLFSRIKAHVRDHHGQYLPKVAEDA